MVQNYRAAVKILDIDIAHGAVFDPVGCEKARLWWYHHGIRAGDDIGRRDAFIEIAIAIDLLKDVAADDLLGSGWAEVRINDRLHDVICSTAGYQRGEDPALGRAVIGRADAYQMLDVLRPVEHPHPVPRDQSTLGMPKDDDLLRTRCVHDGADIGADVSCGVWDEARGARAVIGRENCPAIFAEVRAQ